MTFISREELPVALRAAYDKAAKGVKNDETRTNDKNDETKIDSEREVLIFEQEIELLNKNKKIDKFTYNGAIKSITDIKNEIAIIKGLAQHNRDENERTKNQVLDHNKCARFEQSFKKNFPFLYTVTHIFAPCTEYPSDEFRRYHDKTDLIDNEMKEKLDALW